MDYKAIANTPKSELVVGFKQVLKGIEEGTARCVVVASDSDSFILDKIDEMAKFYSVEVVECPTKAELGRLCRVDVPTATALIKDRK
ncbi:MAG: ribosomal L7Ae/L30e/S12e/Gadd45 family protein [Clostridia bacterium]|nr:ribosomal L7Ae/L30e/S12e/Gadd45 family protein [Clostridia bacterium]